MRPSTLALTLLAATDSAASAFVLPTRPQQQQQQQQQQQLTSRVQHGRHQHQRRPALLPSTRRRHQLWARTQGDGPGDDDLQRLMNQLLNGGGGDRLDVEARERRRRLEIEREQEEQDLIGFVKVGRRLLANLPILALVPFVMLAAVQLSGIAIATAVIAALVVASFSLPVVALALVVPIGIFLLLGTLALPIIPFAVFTIAPSLAILPLFLFLGWLFLQLATGPTLIREDSLFNSFPLDEWLRVDVQDEEELAGAGRKGRPPGREDDGVIDVEAEEDTDAAEAEQLRRFDERLQQRRGGNGDEPGR